MQIDLHGFCLNEAKEEVFWKLKEIVSNEQNQLNIIHAFRNGQVLRKYLWLCTKTKNQLEKPRNDKFQY